MKKILILLLLIAIGLQSGLSQDIYYTRNATLTLNGGLSGKALTLQTSELNVKLDYETAEIIIRFPVSSLTTDLDSLQTRIEKSNSEVVYEGKLGLEYVNTENHPPMQFTTEGWLNINEEKQLIEGTGELHHIGKSNQYACVMGLNMILNLDALNIYLPIEGLDSEFEVVITQALLQRDKN
ncbi:hypothetical protein [Flavilitoribacter nigricans]|uniref:YceI family protein n=1 Tax=Flavilitoribacter nigricans (strain ATCC 23147 / DSM 23189 / NBRC 102662 / NCIMB 1420 / SS-2) TaxID=1122177 RepID=A0A2D0N0E3_FLAN2|nr:hypothetical protein [Flavilitoribacter nigricans]PHN01846.1 hypothetical protein CRP01_35000 [Flavilitoribacter nigricans DSM 23189 = NBRC 102662]